MAVVAYVVGALIGGVIGAIGGFLIGGPAGMVAGAIAGAGMGIRIAGQIINDIEVKKDKATLEEETEAQGLPEDTEEAAIEVAKQSSGVMNLQTKQFQLSGANEILGMKGEQRQGVGTMRSRAAARYIDVGQSPLFNVVMAQRESERQIGMAGESLEASVNIQGRTRDVAYRSFLVGEMKELDDRAQASRDAWMGIFSDAVNTGTGFIDRFWDPNTAYKPSTAEGSKNQGNGVWV